MYYWANTNLRVLDRRVASSSKYSSPHALALRWPFLVTGLMLLGAVMATSPLQNAEGGSRVAGATLELSRGYVALAPICSVYDALTLLSLWQHVALLVFLLLGYGGWRIVRRWRGESAGVFGEFWRFGVALTVIVGVYAGGVLLPRPMARLVLHDPDLIAVDFHSHTNASWDARRSFDAEANRRWHEAAGFQVAYISDHKSLAGARAAAVNNPRWAGTGTTLLQGLEACDDDEHIIALEVDTTHGIDARGTWHEPDYSHALAKELDADFLILSIPGNVRKLPNTRPDGSVPFYAVELSDGSPKGIAQIQRDRQQILHLANTLNLAPVVGSDNHGWGRTAIAWSVLRIPGWQRMTTGKIDEAIEQTLRVNRRRAGIVVARRTVDAGTSLLLLAATPVTVPWTMVRTLSWRERVSWMVWVWAFWGIVTVLRGVSVRSEDPALASGTGFAPIPPIPPAS